MLEVQLNANGTLLRVNGMVDSGASTTSLPIGVADALGVRESLVEGDEGTGVGSSFKTWSSPVMITGQVIAYIPPSGGGDAQPTLWGPVFPLSPMFIEPEDILFGRADFFQAFTVSFECRNPISLFHLDH